MRNSLGMKDFQACDGICRDMSGVLGSVYIGVLLCWHLLLPYGLIQLREA
ncbi:unnamed protein product, partial [Choristocarpus tenellus]